jgi:hypothetical protein
MSLPIAELITQNVVETLGTIQLGGGFKKSGRNSQDDLVCVVGFLDDELDPESADGFSYWLRPYWAIVYIYEPESSSMPYDQRLDIVRADIEKALSRDVSRGGYALNTNILSPNRFDPENDSTGICVNFDVHYRTAIGDPYRIAPGAD